MADVTITPFRDSIISIKLPFDMKSHFEYYDIENYSLDEKKKIEYEKAFELKYNGLMSPKNTINGKNYGLYINMDKDFVKIIYNDKTYYFHVKDNVYLNFGKNMLRLRNFVRTDHVGTFRLIYVYLDGEYIDGIGCSHNKD